MNVRNRQSPVALYKYVTGGLFLVVLFSVLVFLAVLRRLVAGVVFGVFVAAGPIS